ncbi:MAG: hypothetical protein U1F76_08030 [Candidatus Competibacteraceae bacterium]
MLNNDKELDRSRIAVHISWESVIKLGGIGTVLENLLASTDYQDFFDRTILISPFFPDSFRLNIDATTVFTEEDKVLYNAQNKKNTYSYSKQLQSIETVYGVSILYGKHYFSKEANNNEIEVLLIDLNHLWDYIREKDTQRWRTFIEKLGNGFGIDEELKPYLNGYTDYDFEYGMLFAGPAFEVLSILLANTKNQCFLIAHNILGLPFLYKTILEKNKNFHTIFYASECSSARFCIEAKNGSDSKFYNLLKRYDPRRKCLEDIFKDIPVRGKYQLLKEAYRCEKVIAVGDNILNELRFLGKSFSNKLIDLCYHGIPYHPITLLEKVKCRKLFQDYSERIIGYRPDVIMTHIARPIRCKALWRDINVCHFLDPLLSKQGMRGVLYLICSTHGLRLPHDIQRMERDYGWPRHHRQGYPDLQGNESSLNQMVNKFNIQHENLQIVLINSFDWPAGSTLASTGVTRLDIRKATDVEFGQSMYEAFGISQLEPLCFGAICVVSRVSGAANAIKRITQGQYISNILVADYLKPAENFSTEELLTLDDVRQKAIEIQVASQIAEELQQRIPKTDLDRLTLIESGQQLSQKMSWDYTIKDQLLPVLRQM